jgi:hypothetical protein
MTRSRAARYVIAVGAAALLSFAAVRAQDSKPDLSGRWGGGEAGGATVQVREPDGTMRTFPALADYEEALARGGVSPQAVLVGRQTNYRHNNNDYSGKDDAMRRRFTGNPPLYRPEHWEKVQFLDQNGYKEDPSFTCLPGGIPRIGSPTRILQTPTDVVFLYNTNNFLNAFDWRVIPIDGRPHHPVYSKDQTFMGDSVGHWEGDTLVIDVVGFNDLTWLGHAGWFHSTDMRVVERFRREGDLLHYDVTVHDPAVLLEPWVMEHRVLRLNRSTVYTEDAPCVEADSAHIVSRIR